MKRIFLLLNLIILTSKAAYWLNEGFKVNKILLGRSQPVAYVSVEEPDFDSIFNQEFQYLTKGRQTYVFESKDHKYVLKCFRMHRVNPPFWTKILHKANPKEKRLNDWVDSYRIADEQLKEEAGVLYVHLNPTHHLKREVTLIDKLGRKKTIPLDGMGFMIQRKFEPLMEEMLSYRNQSDSERVKEYITGFVQTISCRCHKGVLNHHHFILRDLGIADGRIVEFDVGQLYAREELKNPEGFQKEIFNYTKHFREWLNHEIPEVVVHLDAEIHRAIEEYPSTTL